MLLMWFFIHGKLLFKIKPAFIFWHLLCPSWRNISLLHIVSVYLDDCYKHFAHLSENVPIHTRVQKENVCFGSAQLLRLPPSCWHRNTPNNEIDRGLLKEEFLPFQLYLLVGRFVLYEGKFERPICTEQICHPLVS